MQNVIVLILTLVGCFFFKLFLSTRLRNVITPWALAYTFLVVCVIGTVESKGGMFHFFFTSMNFIPVMILCSGYRMLDNQRSPAWTAFLVFNLYMIIVAFTGYFPLQGPAYFIQVLFSTFFTGYFAARWICNTEGGIKKVMLPLLLVSLVCVLYYVKNMGALSTETLDETGRVTLGELNDEGENMFNQNYLALNLCAIMPFILLGFQWLGDKSIILKWAAMGSMIPLLLVLVRTGSRSGAVGILPCVWYFFRMSKRGKISGKYILLSIVVGLVLFAGIMATNKGVEHLRFFDFKGRDISNLYGGAVTMDTISTGRWDMYKNSIGMMTTVQKIFGAGAALSQYTSRGVRVERFKGGNAHSIFVTIFHRTGFVGSFLFLIFIIVFFVQARKIGRLRGNMAIMFFSVWLLTGIGESGGILGGLTGILAGMGIGLVSRKPATNSEFGEMPAFHGYGYNGYGRPRNYFN